MPSSLECEFLETNGQWFYALQNPSADNNIGHWMEGADAFGPFPTEDNTYIHLHDNSRNPSRYSVVSFPDDNLPPVWRQLLEIAKAPIDSRARGMAPLTW